MRLGPLALAFVLLLGCTQAATTGTPVTTPASPAEPITIHYWDFQRSAFGSAYDEQTAAAQKREIQRFEEENPNLRVAVETFPYDEYRQRLLDAVRAGNPPDVATLDQIWVAEFATAGAIIPLDDRLGGEARPDLFFAGAWQTCVYRDQTWCVPLSNNVWMQLYYNRSLFQAAGLDPDQPPATWQELYDVGQRLNQPPKQYGLALLGEPIEFTVVSVDAFIYSNGGRVTDASNTRALVDQPESVQALDFYQRLTDIAPPASEKRTQDEAIGLFASGQAAMLLMTASQQDNIVVQAPTLDFGIAPLPAPVGKQAHGTQGGWNLAIFAGSPHKQEAFRWINFLSGREVQPTMAVVTPARRDAGREFVRKHYRNPDAVLYMMENSLPRPMTPDYIQLSEIEQRMIQQILTGVPAQQAADRAAAEMNQLLR